MRLYIKVYPHVFCVLARTFVTKHSAELATGAFGAVQLEATTCSGLPSATYHCCCCCWRPCQDQGLTWIRSSRFCQSVPGEMSWDPATAQLNNLPWHLGSKSAMSVTNVSNVTALHIFGHQLLQPASDHIPRRTSGSAALVAWKSSGGRLPTRPSRGRNDFGQRLIWKGFRHLKIFPQYHSNSWKSISLKMILQYLNYYAKTY